MANSSFKQYHIIFDAVAEKVSGAQILVELSRFIDTDSADVQVDGYHVEVRFVTTDTENIFVKCDDVKQRLDKTGNERLFYKIMVISL